MKNKQEKNEYQKKWYYVNRSKVLAKDKLRVKTPEQKELHNISSRKYYANNKEKHHILTKKYKDKLRSLKPPKQLAIKFIPVKKVRTRMSIEEIKEKDRLKYIRRKPIIQQRNKENRKSINKKYREHITIRRKIDPLFKLSRDIPNLIRISIKRNGFRKQSKTSEIIGCDWITLKNHIESKFEYWMSWDNRGKYNGKLNYGWDIDHILPISSAKTEKEILALNHYTNLQPLDSYVNRHIKRNKVA